MSKKIRTTAYVGEVDVEVDMNDIADDELIEAMNSRNLPLPYEPVGVARVERLYYRTRGPLYDRTVEDVRDLLADMLGRAK